MQLAFVSPAFFGGATCSTLRQRGQDHFPMTCLLYFDCCGRGVFPQLSHGGYLHWNRPRSALVRPDQIGVSAFFHALRNTDIDTPRNATPSAKACRAPNAYICARISASCIAGNERVCLPPVGKCCTTTRAACLCGILRDWAELHRNRPRKAGTCKVHTSNQCHRNLFPVVENLVFQNKLCKEDIGNRSIANGIPTGNPLTTDATTRAKTQAIASSRCTFYKTPCRLELAPCRGPRMLQISSKAFVLAIATPPACGQRTQFPALAFCKI